MMQRWIFRAAAIGIVVGMSVTGARCAIAAEPCPPGMVECTVLVPTTVTETRTIHVTQWRKEQREKTVTLVKQVPRRETVTRDVTVMVPQQRTKTVTVPVRKPVFRDVEQTYTAFVPELVTKTATRRVCKMVPTEKTRTVMVDEGHWEDVEVPCCPAPGCCEVRTTRRWVCNPVAREVPYVCYRPVWEEQPYTCQVTVMRPEVRTRTVRKCDFVVETQTKDVCYTVCVPEVRTMSFDVCRVDCVPVEKTISYTVCVPYQVEKQIQVPVCKLVPKTVQVPASADARRLPRQQLLALASGVDFDAE